ncbi:ShlB/FhaC/HecB family hemolysin secretion/activation protein [Pseudomonadota bacterium]
MLELFNRGRALLFGSCCAMVACSLQAAELPTRAQDLPSSAQPGAFDPSRSNKSGLAMPTPDIFMVPPEDDRPFGVNEGERLFVKSIVLRGANDRPEVGISLVDVRSLVEGLRFKRQKLDSEVSAGFTEEELEVGATLLRQLMSDSTDIDIDQGFVLEQMVSDLKFKMQERWLTIGHLQQIAEEVTKYYRQKGYILAQAYLPAQTVQDGQVVIQIMEGMIGDIIVQNNHRYGEGIIKEPFLEGIGKPADKQSVESGLLQLSDYPGLAVFGVFQPGEDVGTADLLLNVRQEKRHEANVQLDNHGSEYTGEYRLQLSYTNNNVTRAADAITINLLQNLKPANSTYGAVTYQRPIINRYNQLIFEMSNNTFKLGGDLAELNVEGSSSTLSAGWRHSFVRSRTSNHYGMVKLAKKSAELSAPLESQDDLAVASIEYGFDAFDFRFSGVNLAWFKYSQGLSGMLGAMEAEDAPLSSRAGTSGHAGSEFSKFEARYDRLQTLTSDKSLLLSLYAQFSSDLLTASEQMPIGGPGSVRAYPISEYLMDNGYFMSLELNTKAPFISEKEVFGSTWGQVLQLVAFAEVGGGNRNDPQVTDVGKVNISGVGFGARIKVDNLSTHIDIAAPLSDEEASNGRNVQLFLTLNYGF